VHKTLSLNGSVYIITHDCFSVTQIKKGGQVGVARCTVSYKWVTAMHGVKLEFNDIISYCIRKTILSGHGMSV